jgi:hypothetical protein
MEDFRMKSSTWRRIGLVAAAALLAGGIGINPVHAQTSTTSAQQADPKKKSTEKKDAAKQAETQTGSGKSAPMSGFRPDPQSNY